MSLGDWESALSSDYAKCSFFSATTRSYEFTDPFIDDVDYKIGSGSYTVAFEGWDHLGDSCTMELDYETTVYAQGIETTDLNVSFPNQSSLDL